MCQGGRGWQQGQDNEDGCAAVSQQRVRQQTPRAAAVGPCMAGRCLQVTCNTRAHRAHTQRPHLCRGACRISHTSLPKAGRSGIAAHIPKPARREQRGTGTGREAGRQAGRWGVPAGRPGKPAAIARVHSRQCLHLGTPQMAGRLQCSRATRFLCCPNQYAAWQRQWAAAVAAPSLLAVSQLPPHACRH